MKVALKKAEIRFKNQPFLGLSLPELPIPIVELAAFRPTSILLNPIITGSKNVRN